MYLRDLLFASTFLRRLMDAAGFALLLALIASLDRSSPTLLSATAFAQYSFIPLIIGPIIFFFQIFRRTAFLTTLSVIISGWIVAYLVIGFIPEWKIVRDNFALPGRLRPAFFVPTMIGAVAYMLWPLSGILLGVYLMRWKQSRVLYAIGAVVGYLVFMPLASPYLSWGSSAVPDVPRLIGFMVFGLLFGLWPSHHDKLALWLGAEPDNGQEKPQKPLPLLLTTYLHFLIALYIMAIPILAFSAYFGKRAHMKFYGNQVVEKYSPGKNNLVDILGEEYVRSYREEPSSVKARSGPGFVYPTDLLDSHPLEDIDRLIGEMDVDAFLQAIEDNEDVTEPWDRLDEAEFYAPFYHERLITTSFVDVREVARAISIRSKIRGHEGDWRGSLDDVERLYRFGGLMTEGTLVDVMIGCAVRGIANDAALVFVQRFHSHPEAMEEFRDRMLSLQFMLRQEMDWDGIEAFEPGMGEILIWPMIAVPSHERAIAIFYRNLAHYDMILLAASMEAYRHEHGSYPGALEDLKPEYLPFIPREPATGADYVYTIDEDYIQIELPAEYENDEYRAEPVRLPRDK